MGFGFRRPKNRVSGLDVAGAVVAVGADVTRFEIGDEVFGIAKGSFAEYAAAREDKLAHKPAGLSFEQAAVSRPSVFRRIDSGPEHHHFTFNANGEVTIEFEKVTSSC